MCFFFRFVRLSAEIRRAAATVPAGHGAAQPQGRPDTKQPVCERSNPPPPVRTVRPCSGYGGRPAARVQGSLQRDLHVHPENKSGPGWQQASGQGRRVPDVRWVTASLINLQSAGCNPLISCHIDTTYVFVCQHCTLKAVLILMKWTRKTFQYNEFINLRDCGGVCQPSVGIVLLYGSILVVNMCVISGSCYFFSASIQSFCAWEWKVLKWTTDVALLHNLCKEKCWNVVIG